MAKTKDSDSDAPGAGKAASAIEGLIAGFARLAERLQQVSDEAEHRFSGTFPVRAGQRAGEPGALKGVYGVSLKVGIGGNELKIEPFGNVRRDEATGEAVVEAEREPLVDVFDEEGGILIVAEMPGVEPADAHVAVEGGVLTLTAERGERKYRKRIDLPAPVASEGIEIRGRNGIVEIKLRKR